MKKPRGERGIGDIYDQQTTNNYRELYEKRDGKELSPADAYFETLIPASLEGKKALDLGAGDGRYAQMLEERGAKVVLAIDWSQAMLQEVNKKRESDHLKRVHPVRADLEQLPIAQTRIDFVLSRFSVMYSRDLSALFSHLAEITSADAEILVEANFATIKNTPESELIKKEKVPLQLSIGNIVVDIENYANTMEDYHKAFEQAGLGIKEQKEFEAKELSIHPDYLHKDDIAFEYVVFQLEKKS